MRTLQWRHNCYARDVRIWAKIKCVLPQFPATGRKGATVGQAIADGDFFITL